MDVHPDRLKGLLKDIVDIYSPSGKEKEVLEYCEAYLRRSGLSPVRQEVDENRFNLVLMPEDDEAELCFVGHVDTVAAYELEDFSFSDRDGVIFGLGTADMKAGCAAMMEAFTVLAERGAALPPIGLALVVDEEDDNHGAEALVQDYDFPWAVIGEPTNLMPCLGHYGYLEVVMRTRGKRAHFAMPERGHNAIESMLKLLLRITEHISAMPQKLFYNIRELSSYPGGSIVPDTCEAYIDLHLPASTRIDVLKTELEQLVREAGQSIPDLDADLKFEDTYSGYEISPERPMVAKLKQAFESLSLKWEPQSFRSHSDGSVLWAAGVDPIILGPGQLEAAHTPGESVSFSQVVQAAQLYLNIARSV